jgi:predicted GIY-YIG superfamily endonuclease
MMFGMFYTYRIRNKETGRTYYGMTCNVAQRWKMHRYSRGANNSCHYLRAALDKHGPDAFDWDVLGTFKTRNEAAQDEVRLLTDAERTHAPLYNLRLPSDSGGLGNRANFAWGKRMPWLDTGPGSTTVLPSELEQEEIDEAKDEQDWGLGVDPTW